tara:strand:+ start:6120 stop:6320 length:201 start_codon:yes stop_codon:yes gene_type:complete
MANYTQSWGSNRTSSAESSALKLKGIIGAKPSALKNETDLTDVSGYSEKKDLLDDNLPATDATRVY